MRIRPFYLFSLVTGAGLALLLVWLLRWNGPAWRPVAPVATPGLVSLPKPARFAPVRRLAGADALRNQTAAELLVFLQQQLEQTGARPREAVLTFSDAAALRRFLARAPQAGITVIGQLDALQAVRVRYDSLGNLQGDMMQNAADYSEVGANFLMQFPTTPAKEDRAAVNQVPFGNDSLAFLGVTGDHSQWGRGTTIAILD